MARHRELEAGFRALAACFRRLEAPPRVEARLLTEFRRQAGSEHRAASRRWIPAFTWAAAFAAMVALAVFLVRPRQPEGGTSGAAPQRRVGDGQPQADGGL